VELLQQRLSIAATGYRKKQRDAIMPIEVAQSVGGATTQTTNIGDVLNSGYELTVMGRLVETQPIRWGATMLLSRRTNKLVRKSATLLNPYSNISRYVEGYPLLGFWGKRILGYADYSRDGVLQMEEIALSDSVVYIGASEPKYTTSFTTDLGLMNGRVTLTASIDYQHGLTQYNGNGMGQVLSAANAPGASLLDLAIAQVSDRVLQGPYTQYYLIQTVNVLRFNSLSVGYVLPTQIAGLMRMKHATVTLQGSNLGIKTGYRGMDPNVNSFNMGNLTADNGQIPTPREWILRVNVSR
jgi:hypothetical protein